ncbi:MAG: tripartite tricarboxylate transporter substrate-binding protein [Pseudomonadota bacterium]
MTRRKIILSTIAATVTLAISMGAHPAFAQAAWPNKPVKLVVPFPAGTSPDTTARLVGDKLSQMWGQPVLVDNRAGAAGGIGAENVKQSPADGHTVLFTVSSVITINPHVYATLRYNPLTDFTGVATVAIIPYVLIATPAAPFNNLAELAEAAKRKPGGIDYASYGVGSQTQVAVEMWSKQMGIKLNHVPYATNPSADLMGGTVSLLFDPATTAIPLIKGNKVKAIAVSSEQRLAALPNVPTASEFIPGAVSTAWHGMFVPKGTPPAVIAKVNADVLKVLAMPDVRSRITDLGLLVGSGSAEDLNTRVVAEHASWGREIRNLNIKLQ